MTVEKSHFDMSTQKRSRYKVKARKQRASLYYSTSTKVSALKVGGTRNPIKDPPCSNLGSYLQDSLL